MFTTRRLAAHRASPAIAVLVLAAMLAPTVLGPGLAAAQEEKAGVITALHGQAVVARPVIQQPLPLKFKDNVFVRDRVETREDSLVRVLLGGKVLVTVRALSTFTATEGPDRVVIDLRTGKAAVGVAPSLLRPGESIEVRTPNAVAGIRGSLLVVTVVQVGNDFRTTFEVPQASKPITVSSLGPSPVSIELHANQSVDVAGTGEETQVGPVTNMTPTQAQAAAETAEAPRPKEQAASSPMAPEIAAASIVQATKLVVALQGPPKPDPMFQQATINKAQGGGATGNLASEVSATSQLQVNATVADQTVLETAGPTTAGPPTAGPTTTGPTTAGPTTAGPTTAGPTTAGPTTTGPTTTGPTTTGPTTAGPTTAGPTTTGPTTTGPTTAGPTTAGPTTTGPTTAGPTTTGPTTTGPTTTGPTTTGPTTTGPTTTGPTTPAPQPPAPRPPVPLADVVIADQTLSSAPRQSLQMFTETSTRTATTPLVRIDQSTVSADSNLVEVSPGPATTPATVTLASALLSASRSSVSSLLSLFQVTRSTFSSSHVDPLIQLNQATVSAGGTDPINPATPTYAALLNLLASSPTETVRLPASVSIAGPLLRATNGTQLTTTGDAIGIFSGGQFTGGSASAALIDLENSRLTTGPAPFRSVLNVSGVGGADGVTPSTANLRGALLNATNGSILSLTGFEGLLQLLLAAANRSTLNLTGGFLQASNGGQVIVSGPGATNSLVTLSGGSHTVAATPVGSGMGMFDLLGRPANVVLDGSGVVENADHPLRHGGPLLETNGATIGESLPSGRFLKIDQAVLDPTLLEASLPLLKASNNSLIRTSADAIDLSAARLTVAGDLIQLNASQFTVVNGALVSVRSGGPLGGSGSRLVVGGNLVTLLNGSTLTLTNGPMLNVSGNSRVDITGALIGFSGTPSTVNIDNNLCAGGCTTIGGLRVQLNGTPAANVVINNPITGAGMVNIPASAAHLQVSGAGSRVTIGPR